MVDPALQILEDLEAGDERMRKSRKDVLDCTAAAIEDFLEDIGAAIDTGSADESLAGLNSVEPGEMADLLACLEKAVQRAFDEGEKRGEELAEDLGELPDDEADAADADTFQDEGVPRQAGEEIAERVAILAVSWRDVIRDAISSKYKPMIRDIISGDQPQDAVREVGELLRGIQLKLPVPRGKEGREELAQLAVEALEPVDPVPSAKKIPKAAGGVVALKKWVREEVKRKGLAIRNTTAETAVIGLDVEASELGKLAVAEADPRVRAIVYLAVLDDRTTAICGGLGASGGFTMSVGDARRRRYMPPIHINCRSGIGFSSIPPDAVNFDTVRTVTVNDRDSSGNVTRVSYTVAPSDIKPSPLGGTAPPRKTLAETIR